MEREVVVEPVIHLVRHQSVPEVRVETEELRQDQEVQEYTTVREIHEETQRVEEEDHKAEEIHDPLVLMLMREVPHTPVEEVEEVREISHE